MKKRSKKLVIKPNYSSVEEAPVYLPQFSVNEVIEAGDMAAVEVSAVSETSGWAGVMLKLPELWKQTEGAGVKVAVLDTGCDLTHPDLKSAIIGTQTFVSQPVQDGNGHGTHCAGIIGARKDGKGFIGVAPKCSLLVGKVLTNQGSGSMKSIAAGISWAVSQGADIISMSLGGAVSDSNLFVVIHQALARGVIIIAAAGNEGAMDGGSAVGYPAKYGSVISVAAHDKNGNISGFSSRGGEVDLAAPGQDIWSTYKNQSYASLSGTSMATPCCAGIAALILAKHKKYGGSTPVRNQSEMLEHLTRMCSHPGFFDASSGYGLLMPFKGF